MIAIVCITAQFTDQLLDCEIYIFDIELHSLFVGHDVIFICFEPKVSVTLYIHVAVLSVGLGLFGFY